MIDLVPISMTGLKKLHAELEELEKEAVEVRKRVGEARQQGDLKENGEYIYGRQQLGFIEGRMGEIRAKINRSEQVDCTKVSTDKARFGTVVTLLDLKTQKKLTWQLLGPHDADIDEGSISIHSPIGDAIYGLTKGQQTKVKTPRGESHFEVVEIAISDVA